MKEITVYPVYEKKEDENKVFLRNAPTKDDFDIFDKTSNLKVINGSTGAILAIILRKSFPLDLTRHFYKTITTTGALRKTFNRSMSSGETAKKRIKSDGTLSNTAKPDFAVESSIIGFFDRYPRTNYCRMSAWTQEHRKEWESLLPYIKHVNDQYRINAPKDYAIQKEIADITSPDFIIPETVYTSVTLNRNFRTHYHRDAGNLEKGLAAISYMQTGKFAGGGLVFPNFRIGFDLHNNDLVIFNNREIHGNLAIKPISKKWERITAVFYYRENMIYCGSVQQELERAKRNKGDQIIGPVHENLNERYNPSN